MVGRCATAPRQLVLSRARSARFVRESSVFSAFRLRGHTMFKTFRTSWALFKSSIEVLQRDRELLWFPVISTIAAILVTVTFLVPLGVWAAGNPELGENDEIPTAFYVGLFLFYVVQYFVIFFFNTALVGAALARFEGRDPTVSDGLRIARERVGAIFGYAVVAATVGILLRAIEERVGVVGKIVIGLLGATWTVASFLVVPVLATRDTGPIEAVKESVSLLKKSWGENLAGHLGFGVIFGLIYFGLAAIFMLGGFSLAGLAGDSEQAGLPLMALMILLVACVLLVAVVQAALKGIYSAALYRHAAGVGPTSGFSEALLDGAIKTRS